MGCRSGANQRTFHPDLAGERFVSISYFKQKLYITDLMVLKSIVAIMLPVPYFALKFP